MSWSLRGKTVLLTGATSGIGTATARALAKEGCELVLLCRDAAKGERLAEELRIAGGPQSVSVLAGDLASQASIREAARVFLASGRPLHVLINNAGVVNLDRRVTVDGIEETFAVNHLGYFLLTCLLADRLRQSAPARVINVASDAHKLGRMDFDDIGMARGYRWMKAYGRSKLANIYFTAELAERMAGTGVTVNCLHPGAVATGLGKNNGVWAQRLIGLLRPFFRTPEGGAETSVYLAVSDDVTGVTGKYFVRKRPVEPARHARDAATQSRLWQVSEQMTGLKR